MSAQRELEDNGCGEIAALLNDQFSRLSRQLRNMDMPDGMTPERLERFIGDREARADFGYGVGGQGDGASGNDVEDGFGVGR